MNEDLSTKVAIITGSSSGIGAATAELLAQKGCRVVVNYSKNKEGAEATADICRKYGTEVLVCQADVSSDHDCQTLVGKAISTWDRIDYLVNNAGTTKFCDHHNLDGLSKEDFLSIYSVNTVGPYLMTRAVVPYMKKNKGSIVNVSSTAALSGMGSSIAYATSKGALNTMTLSLARALGPEIRVNAVCPGFVTGDWLKEGIGEKKYEVIKEQYTQAAPLKVTATPETVAESIYALLIVTTVVTGETLVLDGGVHLKLNPITQRQD